jgi:hypothetical protein
MRKAWDRHQPIETLFNQIQDSMDFSEAGGVIIRAAQQIIVANKHFFATGILTSACRCWNERKRQTKIWNNFKIHFAAMYRQDKQMQGELATNSGYHAANDAMVYTEDEMHESTIGALVNLATATSAYHGVVAALT